MGTTGRVMGMGAIAFVLCALVVGGFSGLWQRQMAWQASPTTQDVAVTGDLEKDGYEIATRASVVSDPKSEYTSVHIHVWRTSNRNYTPIVRIDLGNSVTCGVGRWYVWDTATGSDMVLGCARYVPPSELRTLHTGAVTSID